MSYVVRSGNHSQAKDFSLSHATGKTRRYRQAASHHVAHWQTEGMEGKERHARWFAFGRQFIE